MFLIKSRLLIFTSLSLAVFLTSFGQKAKVYYIDNQFKKCKIADAFYKRAITKIDTIWRVKDYNLNETLCMTGTFSDKDLIPNTNDKSSINKFQNTLIVRRRRMPMQ
jgi:hypothetical protein